MIKENGMQANVKKVGTELAKWISRSSYIWVVNKGKTAPTIERRMAAAART
jgi:hypothetical protein